MTPQAESRRNNEAETADSRHNSLNALARDLVDKVGIEGAIRYCRSLGWLGVIDQVERLRHSH